MGNINGTFCSCHEMHLGFGLGFVWWINPSHVYVCERRTVVTFCSGASYQMLFIPQTLARLFLWRLLLCLYSNSLMYLFSCLVDYQKKTNMAGYFFFIEHWVHEPIVAINKKTHVCIFWPQLPRRQSWNSIWMWLSLAWGWVRAMAYLIYTL